MKKVKLLILIFVAMLIIAGCSNDNDGNGNSDINANNNIINDQNEGNKDENDTDQEKVNSGVMKLGETGFVDDEIGQFEITPTSVEIFKDRDGITPYNDDEVFVLIDYTVKNVGDEPFEGDDILGFRLLLENEQGNRVDEKRAYDFDFVDSITEVIEPGESYDGQMFFDPPESSEYTLHFGSSAADVEDAEWFFTESEAK